MDVADVVDVAVVDVAVVAVTVVSVCLLQSYCGVLAGSVLKYTPDQ